MAVPFKPHRHQPASSFPTDTRCTLLIVFQVAQAAYDLAHTIRIFLKITVAESSCQRLGVRPEWVQPCGGPTIVRLFESVRNPDELLWGTCSRIVANQAENNPVPTVCPQ
jgi:hypothetical protein